MRSFRYLHGFLKHLAAFTGICHHQSRKLSTKSIHFLNRIYPHKPNNPIPRKNTKNHPKSTPKQQPLDPKTYMRETDANITESSNIRHGIPLKNNSTAFP
ncbi:hypothetical protein ACFX2I_027159 [Malus domestica]